MKKLFIGMLAIAGMLTGSCSADDQPEQHKANVSLDGEPGGGTGTIPPVKPAPPPPWP